MPADNSSFVAGHYTFGFGPNGSTVDVGTTEQGISIHPVFYKEEIRVDDLGDTVVDGIFRGYNVRMRSQLSQWAPTTGGRAAVRQLQNQFDTAAGSWTLANIGQTMIGSFAKTALFAPIANINSNNKTFTFIYTIPDGDHGGWALNTKLRRVDVNLLVLPNLSTGVLFTEV